MSDLVKLLRDEAEDVKGPVALSNGTVLAAAARIEELEGELKAADMLWQVASETATEYTERALHAEARVKELEGALADANVSVIAFGSMWATAYQRDHGLDGLHPHHFDILQKAGAKMDLFKRATNAQIDAALASGEGKKIAENAKCSPPEQSLCYQTNPDCECRPTSLSDRAILTPENCEFLEFEDLVRTAAVPDENMPSPERKKHCRAENAWTCEAPFCDQCPHKRAVQPPHTSKQEDPDA